MVLPSFEGPGAAWNAPVTIGGSSDTAEPPQPPKAVAAQVETASADAYFDDIIDSLPDHVELPQEPAGPSRTEVRSRDTWKARHSLEEAVARLSPEIRQVLAERLNGEFREVRRYEPSRTLDPDSAASGKTGAAEEPEALVPDEDEGD